MMAGAQHFGDGAGIKQGEGLRPRCIKGGRLELTRSWVVKKVFSIRKLSVYRRKQNDTEIIFSAGANCRFSRKRGPEAICSGGTRGTVGVCGESSVG